MAKCTVLQGDYGVYRVQYPVPPCTYPVRGTLHHAPSSVLGVLHAINSAVHIAGLRHRAEKSKTVIIHTRKCKTVINTRKCKTVFRLYTV